MYKYIYVQANSGGPLFQDANYKELIDKYSAEGWRFVTAIPSSFNGHGLIIKYDLVFEKEE